MNNSFISIVWNSSRFLFNASCFNMHSSECKWSRKIIPAIRIIFRQAPWNKSACDLFIRCSLSTSHNRRISISSPSFVSHCNHLFFFSFLFFFIYSTPRSSFRIFLDLFFSTSSNLFLIFNSATHGWLKHLFFSASRVRTNHEKNQIYSALLSV